MHVITIHYIFYLQGFKEHTAISISATTPRVSESLQLQLVTFIRNFLQYKNLYETVTGTVITILNLVYSNYTRI